MRIKKRKVDPDQLHLFEDRDQQLNPELGQQEEEVITHRVIGRTIIRVQTDDSGYTPGVFIYRITFFAQAAGADTGMVGGCKIPATRFNMLRVPYAGDPISVSWF